MAKEYDRNHGRPTHDVNCPGEAHSPGVDVDHCMVCLPNWGRIAIPVECSTLEEARKVWDGYTKAALEILAVRSVSPNDRAFYPGQLRYLARRGFARKAKLSNGKGAMVTAYVITSEGIDWLGRKLDEQSEPEEDTCDECGEPYPAKARSMIGPWHAESCSLHEKTEVDTAGRAVR